MSQYQQSLFSHKAKETMDKTPINQQHKRYLSPSSVSSEPPSSTTDQRRSRMEPLRNLGDKEQPPHPQPVDMQQVQFSMDVPNHQRRHISSPYILQRFLTIEMNNEPLRYEAHIGILEGRVREGEDMLDKRMYEEGWEEVDALYEAVDRDLGMPTEEGDISQSRIEASSIDATRMSLEAYAEASATGSATRDM